MEFLGRVVDYFGAAENWTGRTGIASLLRQHAGMSLLSLVIAGVLTLPPALYIGHRRRFEFLVVTLANVGRALPSLAILAFLVPFSLRLGLGLGFWPTVVALVALAIPPILTNTYVGIQGVEADTVEAARGAGMSEWQLLERVEIPLAAPMIMTGIRIATLQVIATATLAALFGWGGLGQLIVLGFAVRDLPKIFAGALLVAVLAIAVDLLLGWLARVVAPRTSSGQRGRRRTPPVAGEYSAPPTVDIVR